MTVGGRVASVAVAIALVQALEVALVIGFEIFAEQLDGPLLQGQQRVGLDDLILNLGARGLPVECADGLHTGQEEELVLEWIAPCELCTQHESDER